MRTSKIVPTVPDVPRRKILKERREGANMRKYIQHRDNGKF